MDTSSANRHLDDLNIYFSISHATLIARHLSHDHLTNCQDKHTMHKCVMLTDKAPCTLMPTMTDSHTNNVHCMNTCMLVCTLHVYPDVLSNNHRNSNSKQNIFLSGSLRYFICIHLKSSLVPRPSQCPVVIYSMQKQRGRPVDCISLE